MIPAGFDYEVAESVDHALELLRTKEDAKLHRRRPQPAAADEAAARPAGHAGGHRPPVRAARA